MITAAQHPIEQIEASVGTQLRCPRERSAIIGATAAEHIRTMLFGVRSAQGLQTLHTTRVLANARRAIELTWPLQPNTRRSFEETGADQEFCLSILRSMALLGDAWDTGRGQWLGAPLRVVVSEGASRGLIAGAMPVALAEHKLGSTISSAGASRFAALDSVNDRDLMQSVDSWLGQSTALDAWTAQMLALYESRMEALHGLTVDHLEIYAPDILRTQRRSGRWISADELGRPLGGVRMCRPKAAYAYIYDRPHYLAHFHFQNGSLSLRHSALVAREASLRLRFGLDVSLHSPRQLTIVESAETFAVEKPLKLPDPESRVYGLGWRDRLADASSETLTFHRDALPFIKHALLRLSISPVIARR
jgi:hypothetical protein